MLIKFHKNSIKFLEKCSKNDKEKIRIKLFELKEFYDGTNLSNINNLQIKNLDGEWKGFHRLKIGKLRIIYKLNREKKELTVFEIDYRGDIYK